VGIAQTHLEYVETQGQVFSPIRMILERRWKFINRRRIAEPAVQVELPGAAGSLWAS